MAVTVMAMETIQVARALLVTEKAESNMIMTAEPMPLKIVSKTALLSTDLTLCSSTLTTDAKLKNTKEKVCSSTQAICFSSLEESTHVLGKNGKSPDTAILTMTFYSPVSITTCH